MSTSRSPPDPPGHITSKKEGISPTDEALKGDGDAKAVRPHKPLNRVPRACNACRKQKMRCEGAENPPCKRCRHAGIECLFEKPVRDTVTTEQGLERIRSLENQVTSMQSTLTELVSAIRQHGPGMSSSMPMQQSPTPPHHHLGSSPHQQQYMAAQSVSPALLPSPQSSVHSGGPQSFSGPSGGVLSAEREMAMQIDRPQAGRHNRTNSMPGPPPHQPMPPGMQNPPFPQYPPQHQMQQGNGHHQPIMMAPPTYLPPFSTLQSNNQPYPPQQQQSQPPYPMSNNRPPPHPQIQAFRQKNSSGNFSSPPQPSGPGGPSHGIPFPPPQSTASQMGPYGNHHHRDRLLPTSSNVTSADSSDDEGELPPSGLVAPLAVLRGLADAAENDRDGTTDGSAARTRSHSPDVREPSDRPQKKRKTHHNIKSAHIFRDVVTRGAIDEREARELFEIFFRGCSTFLPVLDAQVDNFDALRTRSPFCVDAICMVAAKVKDGGGPPGETYRKCMEEVQRICCATLFSPVSRLEAVQAMILVAGWSDDGGWLGLGHAIRMAFELGMNKAWPKLLRRITSRKTSTTTEERELVIATRTWFTLYLFEHQLSLGTGRPAILRGDDTVDDPRMLLQHPLTTDDDMRLVSMVEMMLIRERTHEQLKNENLPPADVYNVLRSAHDEFASWYSRWDQTFSQKFEDATFYRQSLQIQRDFCLLWHFAGALRGIKGPEDVAKMPPQQTEIAMHSIKFAQAGLDVCLRSPSYREGLKYAVHFTHASATFAASLLIRLARLFPRDCDVVSIMSNVEDLATLLSQVPAGRYAKTLRLMLQTARKRRVLPPRTMSDPTPPSNNTPIPAPDANLPRTSPQNPHVISPPGLNIPLQPGHNVMPMMASHLTFGPQFTHDGIEQFAPGFELGPGQEPPVWLSETNLGEAFSQYGFETFFIPPQFDDQRVPEIW